MSVGKNIVNVAFPNCWFKDGFAQSSCFNICHENVGKGIETAVFAPIAVPWVCRQCFPLKWRKFFLRINLNIRQVRCRNTLPVEIFIYFKDNFNTLVLRYISSRLITSIETRNVRFFTFQDICLFTETYDLSVILILVVAMYQEIL